jgi:ribosomal protein L11 methyltransferase
MGFGTGHHATTRLCLAALQASDIHGSTVLDVGTGSGVLAIAADLLGAASVIGIDSDPDAIQSALETATLNPDARHASFEIADLSTTALPVSDLITANLTGALLERSAAALLNALTPNGRLIISGIQVDERDSVLRQFQPVRVLWEQEEEGWLGVILELQIAN